MYIYIERYVYIYIEVYVYIYCRYIYLFMRGFVWRYHLPVDVDLKQELGKLR